MEDKILKLKDDKDKKIEDKKRKIKDEE